MKFAACLLLLCGLLAEGQTEPAEMTFDRAAKALSAGDFQAAERGFQTVLKQQPDNVGAIGNLGVLYARTNRTAKAIAQYQHALQLSPDDASILLNLGIVYLKEEQYGKAEPCFERVLRINPQQQQARRLLDVCRVYTGRAPTAIQDLKALAQQNPQDDQLLFLLGLAYLKTGDSQTAQSVFNRMLEAAGPTRAQFLLGKASYEAALFPQAEQSFLEVLRIEPNFPGAHLELGKVYISERRTADAIAQLKTALQQDPGSEEANYFLGSLLIRENQYEQGVPYLEKAKQLKPDAYGVYVSGKGQAASRPDCRSDPVAGRGGAVEPG